MTEPRNLSQRVLEQVVEQTRDHQQILVDFASRLEPQANQLIDVWTNLYRDMTAAQPLAGALARASQESVARSFFGELKQGHLSEAFVGWAVWARELARVGMPYDLVLKLLREYQRTMLPYATSLFVNTPELPLVLDALDDVFDGGATMVGAACIEALHERFVDSAHLNVLGQLTGGAAHAINNLLAAIVGQVQILSEQTSDYALRDELQEIQNMAAVGARVLRRVQNYGLSKDGDEAVTDVNQLLREASEITRFLWRDQAESEGVVIDVVKDFADVPAVMARPAELRHAFVTLILNSAEAMPRGGLITLRTERKEDSVLVSIIDNGKGVPLTAQPYILDPFFSSKESPHLGLGLSAAQRIVAEHHGTLAMESIPNEGTTVTLALPVARSTKEEKEKKSMISPSHAANILVIDNEPAVRGLLSRLLQMHGHNVQVAEGGAEGIAAFKANKFDWVFTDLGMPEMSGWDVAREIRKVNPKVMIALTTGWPVELSPEELKERGIDRVVNKPFNIQELVKMIDESLAAG